MKVVFTKHLLKRIKERGFLKTQIKEIILNPDRIIQEKLNRFRAVKIISKNNKIYLFIVIYDKINSMEIKVITAFLTSKIKKFLK